VEEAAPVIETETELVGESGGSGDGDSDDSEGE
jgi:hypothetical protein